VAKHEVNYDEDGLSLNDPWTLDEYFQEDNMSLVMVERAKESVLSWLCEYHNAGVDLELALGDLARSVDAEAAR
jgi:hypothetical protein